MRRAKPRSAGGIAAIAYSFGKARQAGGLLKLYRRMRTRNACKTCALGMGGQQGGMTNEAGRFLEVCKKSIQAQAGDMARPISEDDLRRNDFTRMAALGSEGLERLGRLGFPLLAGPGDERFFRISWEEALERTAAAFNGTHPDQSFFYSSGRASNEAAFVMQLVARAYGTNNVNNCSFYCHSASSVALAGVYGSGTASVTLEDLDRADLALVAGANPASNHPRLITKLVELRRRGGRVIIINPLRELGLERFRIPSDLRSMLFGSTVSDLYLQPRVGGDVALFKALLKGLVERGACARDFIEAHTEGWGALSDDLHSVSSAGLASACGVDEVDIARAVEMLAGAGRGIMMWAMGLTHHENGVDNVLALSNVALARGWLGQAGAGLLPIRGHSNVQGVGSCGVTPKLKDAFAARLEEAYGIEMPVGTGLDTYQSMAAAAGGRIHAALLLGGNLFASNPDRSWASRALGRIDTTVYVSTKLNEGHVHGRGRTCIVLPALARDEEAQPTTQESMFNYVRLSDGGPPVHAGEMRSEVEILASLAERILPAGRFDWSRLRSHDELRAEMARAVPGYAQVADIGKSKREFQVEGRSVGQPPFKTDSGRARFRVTPLPRFRSEPGQMRLMTLRSEGQFNTVVYEQADRYRGNTRRDIVMMSAGDAQGLGLVQGQAVVVEAEAGSMEVSVSLADISLGSLAMYYPEANRLVPRRLDPRSGTPAFKSVTVTVRPALPRHDAGDLIPHHA